MARTPKPLRYALSEFRRTEPGLSDDADCAEVALDNLEAFKDLVEKIADDYRFGRIHQGYDFVGMCQALLKQ